METSVDSRNSLELLISAFPGMMVMALVGLAIFLILRAGRRRSDRLARLEGRVADLERRTEG